MKVLIASDSFKGSLDQQNVIKGITQGIKDIYSDASIESVLIADGGEGTINALTSNLIYLKAHKADGVIVDTYYGIINDTVIIEVATIIGVTMQKPNAYEYNSFGVGELILDAIKRGYRKFLIGLGGSATNDCGIGMLEALGYKFADINGFNLEPKIANLDKIKVIDSSSVCEELGECKFTILSDVTNKLLGKNGATYIFGAQKGIKLNDFDKIDSKIECFANICSNFKGNNFQTFPGSGAAGGLGYAFLCFLNADMKSGIEEVLKLNKFDEKVINADYVITGEGMLDKQSLSGKVIFGVVKHAKKYNKKVIALVGGIKDISSEEIGIVSCFPIIRHNYKNDEFLDSNIAYNNLVLTTREVFKLIKSVSE